jgi:hypothetical protein
MARAAPAPLDDEEWQVLLQEQDEFRLIIRAHTAIETLIDASVERLFTQQWQGRMRRLGGFQTRLTLAIAMGVVDADLDPAMSALARLRNDFAHGTLDSVPRGRARTIVRAAARIVTNPPLEEWLEFYEQRPPHGAVRDVFELARVSVKATADQILEFRREGERLVVLHGVLRTRAQELRAARADDEGDDESAS